MIPLIIAVAAAAACTAAYQYFSKDEEPKKPEYQSLGTFVLWGRPNAGKTTFIARLRGEPPGSKDKIATTSRTVYSDVQLTAIKDKYLKIDKVVDMPGTDDRLSDWLEMVGNGANIFYMVDLSRINNKDYAMLVKKDLLATAGALNKSKSEKKKRINIICSHVDVSGWANLMRNPDFGNLIQKEAEIRLIYESLHKEGVAGYFYFANLNDKRSSDVLIESIANDLYD